MGVEEIAKTYLLSSKREDRGQLLMQCEAAPAAPIDEEPTQDRILFLFQELKKPMGGRVGAEDYVDRVEGRLTWGGLSSSSS